MVGQYMGALYWIVSLVVATFDKLSKHLQAQHSKLHNIQKTLTQQTSGYYCEVQPVVCTINM